MTDLHAVQASSPVDLLAEWERISASGDAMLPLDPAMPAVMRATVIDHLRPATLTRISADHGREVTRHEAEPVPDGTALVVATSGSSGAPKGVVLSDRALSASTSASVRRLGVAPGEGWACVLPLHHVAGLQTVLRSRAVGAEVSLLPGFTENALAAVGAAHIALVPTQLRRALDAGVDLQRFRTVLLGGAAPGDDLLSRAADARINVVTSYGMTETCGGCVYDGRPLDGVTVDLDPSGRVRVAGPVLFDGYHRDPELTSAHLDGGRFTTDDLGRLDGDHLTILGRRDEVLISGGENVSAPAVRAALLQHPDITDAHVFGVDDPEWGQRVVAIVEAAAAPGLTEATIRDHARVHLPAAAVPKQVAIVTHLPLDGLGKVSRATAEALLGRR